MRSGWKRWVGGFGLVMMLAGCATVQQPPLQVSGPAAYLNQFRLEGRIAVRNATSGETAGLNWRHVGDNDEISLLTPLGSSVARITRGAAGVQLETANGRHYEAHDVAGLTQQVLGYPLPLEGLQYWVQGKAIPGVPADVQRGANGLVSSIAQQGWQIQYPRYLSVGGQALPGLVQLTNGSVNVRVLVEEWNLSGSV